MTTHGLPAARPGFGVELSPTVAMQPALAAAVTASAATTVATKTNSFFMQPPSVGSAPARGARRRSDRIVAAASAAARPKARASQPYGKPPSAAPITTGLNVCVCAPPYWVNPS